MDISKLPGLHSSLREIASDNFVRLNADESVEQAGQRLRDKDLSGRIVYFYVVDQEERLVGVVPTRRLLLSDQHRKISDVMIAPAVAIEASQSYKAALEMMVERRLLALPVVDADRKIIGVVDLTGQSQSIVEPAQTGDLDRLYQIAGIHIDDRQARSTVELLRRRFPWLICNLVSGIAGALLAALFHGLLDRVVAVSFFIPVVLTLVESISIQALSVSLQRPQLELRRARASLIGRTLREVKNGLVLGACAAALVGLVILGWFGDPFFALAILISISLSAGFGAFLGYVTPRTVHRLKLDPKIASGPAVLAVADLAALGLYFGTALWLV